MMAQAVALARRPHVVVGTPGRVVDHLTNTKGFALRALRHLVLDEADRLLNMDFEQEIDTILKAIPKVGAGGVASGGGGGAGGGPPPPGCRRSPGSPFAPRLTNNANALPMCRSGTRSSSPPP